MATLLSVNPARRKTTRKRAPARRTVRRRRNPSARQNVTKTVMTGLQTGAGAFAVDVIFEKLPIPLTLKTGAMSQATKALVGYGLGFLLSKYGKMRTLGKNVADGAVTVAAHNAIKQVAGPMVGVSGIDDGGLLGYYYDDEMGYLNPAPTYVDDIDENDDGILNGMGYYHTEPSFSEY